MKIRIFAVAAVVFAMLSPITAQAAIVDFVFNAVAERGSNDLLGTPFSISFSYDTALKANSTSDYGYGDGKVYLASYNSNGGNAVFSNPITVNYASGTEVFSNGSIDAYFHGGYLTPSFRTTYLVRALGSMGRYIELMFQDTAEREYSEGLPLVMPATGSAAFYPNNSSYAIGTITAVVPEPATWAMMVGGFGAMGAMLRRRRRVAAVA